MIEAAIICMALNIYWEARSEPLNGQHAVAQVTMNRAGRDPFKVCEVVFEPYQFSWANPLTTTDKGTRRRLAPRFIPKETQAWRMAKGIAKVTIGGWIPDFTHGATHYHADYIAKPYWVRAKQRTFTIGKHHFYRKVMRQPTGD